GPMRLWWVVVSQPKTPRGSAQIRSRRSTRWRAGSLTVTAISGPSDDGAPGTVPAGDCPQNGNEAHRRCRDSPRSGTVPARLLPKGGLFESLQVGDEGVALAARQREARHLAARFVALRIFDPAREIGRVVRQCQRGERLPRGEVRQIGADRAAGARAADHVAARTRQAEKEVVNLAGLRGDRLPRGPLLVDEPPAKEVGLGREHVNRHVHVLLAAELGALAAVLTRAVGVQQ